MLITTKFIFQIYCPYACIESACKQVFAVEEIQQTRWASWTCVVGPEINGIWEKYADANDVNAADANFGNEVVATGDDFGIGQLIVRCSLFRFRHQHSTVNLLDI